MSRTSDMHAGGESDGRVVPTKCPNKGGQPPAEVHGGKATDQGEHRAGDRAPDSEPDQARRADLLGVREAARKDKRTRFTALLHHVTVESAAGQLLRAQAGCCARSRWHDVEGVRDGPG